MNVRILTVGDELLTGETENTNASWLCRQLTDLGTRVDRVVVIPDVIEQISEEVLRAQAAADAVLVTGGVGPTHDDVTMAGIAEAIDRPLEENETAKEWLITEGGYAAEDLLPETTTLPAGSTPLHNETGVAPGAMIAGIYVFPGVPSEMRPMFKQVAEHFRGNPRYREVVVIDEPESQLLSRFKHLRSEYAIDVGSYPGEQVRVRLAGEDPEEVNQAATWLREVSTVSSPEDEPGPGERDS